MRETNLAMAERHVREGAVRISCQKALITALTRNGHDRMVPLARELLREFERTQAMSEEHLAHYQAEAAAGQASALNKP